MEWFYRNFDEDNAKCLFCQGECDIHSSSLAPDNYNQNKYTCRQCREHYTVFVFLNESSPGMINISHIYDFSCGDYTVSLAPPGHSDSFLISRSASQKSVEIPKFEIDLSNKEKLLEKLKTYLLFS